MDTDIFTVAIDEELARDVIALMIADKFGYSDDECRDLSERHVSEIVRRFSDCDDRDRVLDRAFHHFIGYYGTVDADPLIGSVH